MDILTRLDGADQVITHAAVEADHADGVVFAERQPFEDPESTAVAVFFGNNRLRAG